MAAHQAPSSLGFSRQEHWSGLPFPSPMHENEKWKWSRLVVSDSPRPHGLQPSRLLRPWDRPVNQERRNSDFIQESKCLKRWQTGVLQYHLIRVWLPVSFIRGGGGEKVKSERRNSCKISPGLASIREEMCSFLLCSLSQVGRFRVSSCELNEGSCLTFSQRGRAPRGRPLCMLLAMDSVLLVVIVTNIKKAKGKETDPTWSQVLFFPVTPLWPFSRSVSEVDRIGLGHMLLWEFFSSKSFLSTTWSCRTM